MSFSAEIKDFINGYGAGKKIQQGDAAAEYRKLAGQRLKQQIDLNNDPRMKELSIQRLQAQVNYFNRRGNRQVDPELTKGRALNNQLRGLQIDSILHPEKYAPKVPGAADDAPAMAPASVGPRSALDVNSNVAQNQPDPSDDEDNDTSDVAGADDPTMYSATGGLVTRKGYADGGEVDDEPEAPEETPDESDITPEEAQRQDAQDSAEDGEGDEGDDEPVSALPVRGQAQAPTSKTEKQPVDYSTQAGHDAALAGLKFAAKASGHDGGDGALTTDLSARSAGSAKYLRGHGAMDPDDFNAVANKVDPDHTLPEAQRNMATLATKYMWDLKHKGPHEADAAAASMTQYMRMTSDRYKAIAQAAAHHGDLDTTMQAMVRSYANIPTGSDLKLEKTPEGHVNWSITDDQTGKQVQGGLLTPDELLGWATKGGMPSFDSLLAQSAAGRKELADNEKASKGPAPMKPSERKATSDALGTVIDNLPPEQAVSKEDRPDFQGTAFQIQKANPDSDPADIVRATQEMTKVDPANPTTRTFSTVGPAPGGIKYKLSNGASVVLPPDVADRIAAQRGKNVLAAQEALKKGKTTAARMGETINAAVQAVTPNTSAIAVSPAVKNARRIGSAIRDAIPSTVQGGAIPVSPPDFNP